MSAYLLAIVDVQDAGQYREYTKLVPDIVAAHGGRFIVRGAETEVLEGELETRRIVIIEFPSADHVRAFYNSPEYTEARKVREGVAIGRLILLHGV